MSTTESQARRQFAQNKLAEMATLNEAGRLTVLRHIMASVLEFTPVNSTTFTIDNPLLPKTATVIAELANEFGPDYTAVHFDLSEQSGTDPRHPEELLAQVQAANSMVQQYADDERYPLLIFTRSNSVQFITGDPVPGDGNQLRDILQAVFHWNNHNGDAHDLLSQVGGAIAEGEVPRLAFRAAFDNYIPAQCQHCDTPLTSMGDYLNIWQALVAVAPTQSKVQTMPTARQKPNTAKSTKANSTRTRNETKQSRLFGEFDKVWNGNSRPTIDDFRVAHARCHDREVYEANTRRQLAIWCATREDIRAADQDALKRAGYETDRYRSILSNKSGRRRQRRNTVTTSTHVTNKPRSQ